MYNVTWHTKLVSRCLRCCFNIILRLRVYTSKNTYTCSYSWMWEVRNFLNSTFLHFWRYSDLKYKNFRKSHVKTRLKNCKYFFGACLVLIWRSWQFFFFLTWTARYSVAASFNAWSMTVNTSKVKDHQYVYSCVHSVENWLCGGLD